MKTTKLTIAIDQALTKVDINLFAYNIAKTVELVFGTKVDYNVVPSGNTYILSCEDKRMEMEISDFIESNWNL